MPSPVMLDVVRLKLQDNLVVTRASGASKPGRPSSFSIVLPPSVDVVWQPYQAAHAGLALRGTFESTSPTALAALVQRAKQLKPGYTPPKFNNRISIVCPAGMSADQVARDVRQWPGVEWAYRAPRLQPASERTPRFTWTPPFQFPPGYPLDTGMLTLAEANLTAWLLETSGGHLSAAPTGVGAVPAWAVPGAMGEGSRLVDIELGWTAGHVDLSCASREVSAMGTGQILDVWRDHGTNSLGVVAALANQHGYIGVAPRLPDLAACSPVLPHSNGDATHALAETLTSVGSALVANQAVGPLTDVVLIELQVGDFASGEGLPVEVSQDVFDAIQLLTAAGITVVEPAGNGMKSLDAYTPPPGSPCAGQYILARGADRGDSGAIVVAAASSAAPHVPLVMTEGGALVGGTNWGSRVDCYAWGENVKTSASNADGATDLYRTDFDGTSAASAIVAGVACSVQSMAVSAGQVPYAPEALRTRLSRVDLGTPQAPAPAGQPIGIMPDLVRLATSVTGASNILRRAKKFS